MPYSGQGYQGRTGTVKIQPQSKAEGDPTHRMVSISPSQTPLGPSEYSFGLVPICRKEAFLYPMQELAKLDQCTWWSAAG